MFGKQASSSDGIRPWCKTCVKDYNKRYKSGEGLRVKQEANARHREKNKDKLAQYFKKLYALKSNEIKLRSKLRRISKPEECRKVVREWHRKNRKSTYALRVKCQEKRKLRVPNWLTKEHILEMKAFYTQCPKGYHVDHIIPLLGKTVSGLHVPWNLQYLPALENIRKGNRI